LRIRMTFQRRLALMVAAVTVAVLALVAMVGVGVIERAHRDLIDSRLEFVLTTLDGTIEASLDLGLPLGELREIEDLLERTLSAEPGIEAIEVFDATGVSRFGTDRGAANEPIPRAWVTAIRDNRSDPIWRAVDRGGLTIGAPILTDFGAVAGDVAIIVPLDLLERSPVDAGEVLLIALGPAVAAALLAGLVILWAARPTVRLYRRIADDVAAGRTSVDAGGGLLATATAAATARIAATAESVSRADRILQAIDAEI
jgi:hypothetical protein